MDKNEIYTYLIVGLAVALLQAPIAGWIAGVIELDLVIMKLSGLLGAAISVAVGMYAAKKIV